MEEPGRALSTPPPLKSTGTPAATASSSAVHTGAVSGDSCPLLLSNRRSGTSASATVPSAAGDLAAASATAQSPPLTDNANKGASGSARQQQMGESSSQSSSPNSRASSSSSASATPAANATTATRTAPNPCKSSGAATPAATPPAGSSPALAPGGIRLVPERGTRSSRKHKGGTGSGSRYGRTTSGGCGPHLVSAGSTEDARYPRTAFDQCKTARTIAAQWMSRLMRSPPEAARIESLRAAHASRSPHGSPVEQLHEQPPPTQGGEGEGGGGAASTTFLAAVLKSKGTVAAAEGGAVTDSSTTAASDGDAAAATVAAAATSSPTPPQGNPGNSSVGSSTIAPLHYESLELVPDDLSKVPSLLHALREIALSCASLDTLGKASGKGSGASPGLSGGEEAPDSKRKANSTPGGRRLTPPAAGLASSSPSRSPAAPPVDEAALVTRNRELHGEYEQQWESVRSHFATVRSLILNDKELVEVLDAALGVDWRADSAAENPADERVTGALQGGMREARLCSCPSPIDADRGNASAAPAATPPSQELSERAKPAPAAATTTAVAAAMATLNSAAIAASSPLSRSAKEYVPRDFYVSPTSTVAASTNPDHVAAVAANSTLNSNAEPFRTRFAGGSGGPSAALDQGDGGNAIVSLTTPAALSRYTDPVASVNAGAIVDRSLVEASVYSPSQVVTSFLERVTPPPRPDLASSSQTSIFPSTPPARVAVMGKSPRRRAVSTPDMSVGVEDCGSHDDSTRSSPGFSPLSAATTGGVGGTGPAHPHQSQPQLQSQGAGSSKAGGGPAFRLESREDMLRRRNAAPNTFYSSTTHYYNTNGGCGTGTGNGCNSASSLALNHAATASNATAHSAATTPASLFSSSPNGLKVGMPYMSSTGGHGPRSMPVSPIVSYSTPVVGPQCPYDYILVIDFEATCEEHPPVGYLYEIIEFPVVLVDVHLQRAVAEFHRFVKPRVKTELSEFCKALTGIEQSDVDEAAPLEDVILQFERWYHQTLPPNARTVFATDGPMDFKEFMHNHSVLRQNIRFPNLFYQWIDVKQTFAHFFQCQQGKIKAMLEVLHCPFEGRLHSGIDDARNIARIVIGLLQWGCTFCEVPLSRIQHHHTGAGSPGSAVSSSSLSFGSPLHLPPSTVSTSTSPANQQQDSDGGYPAKDRFANDQG